MKTSFFCLSKFVFGSIAILIFSFLLWSCSSSDEYKEELPDLSTIDFTLKINRLEADISKIQTVAEAGEFVSKYPDFADKYLLRKQFGDSATIEEIFKLSQSPYIDTLTQEVNAHLSDIEDIRLQLETAFKVIKYHYPDFKMPEVYTVVTGFSNDLFVDSSIVVIGIDYFLGKNTRYTVRNHQGEKLPAYMTDRYQKNYIAPAVMILFAQVFNQKEEMDKTLLSEMIAFGKTYQFAKMTLPEVPDSVLISYSGEETEKCFANQDLLWAHFVQKNLFFDKGQATLNKYIGERPFTSEIGDDCPGRIGRWIGWQIVRNYLKNNPEATLPMLMKEQRAQYIFEKSKYRPMQ